MSNNISSLTLTIRERESFPRILPFALFMGFIGAGEIAGYLKGYGIAHMDGQLDLILYPLRTEAVGLALILLGARYTEFRFKDFTDSRQTLLSVIVGFLVFILWIHLDFQFGFQSAPEGFNPTLIGNEYSRWAMIFIRLAGLVLVAPVMEEIFWRSFLIRFVTADDFLSVPLGAFTWTSFTIGAVLFGLEHTYIIAGIMAGAIYNILLYRTKSIAQCVLAHATTNCALGNYVLYSGQWRFW